MIIKTNHVSLFVLNQESAYNFYINKLGFKVHTNATAGQKMRWLTVCPPKQTHEEIILTPIEKGMMFTKAAEHMRELVTQGTFALELSSA